LLLEHRPPYYPTPSLGCYLSTTDVLARQVQAATHPKGEV